MPQQDFDVAQLAAYLHLTPDQVSKMAERDKLPGRKIAGDWRFSRAEIHHWLEERIGVSDEDELVEVEEVLDRAARRGSDENAISIATMLPVEAIAVPLAARTRSKVISAMSELAAGTGMLWDPAKMIEAVRARENLHPTALDNGVALLHPRRPLAGILSEAFLALGRTHQGIPFGGGSGLTDVFFLICSTSDREHLRTLARLSRMLGDNTFLGDLRACDDAASTHQLIAEFEEQMEA